MSQNNVTCVSVHKDYFTEMKITRFHIIFLMHHKYSLNNKQSYGVLLMSCQLFKDLQTNITSKMWR